MSNYEKILKFLGYRLVRFIILLIAIIIISFIMVDLSPINPVKTYISNMIVSPEQVAALEAYWGVNEPITAKIMNWLGNIIHGDLGNSLIFRIPVIDVIKEKFFASLILMMTSWAISGVLGFLLGIVILILSGMSIRKIKESMEILEIEHSGNINPGNDRNSDDEKGVWEK